MTTIGRRPTAARPLRRRPAVGTMRELHRRTALLRARERRGLRDPVLGDTQPASGSADASTSCGSGGGCTSRCATCGPRSHSSSRATGRATRSSPGREPRRDGLLAGTSTTRFSRRATSWISPARSGAAARDRLLNVVGTLDVAKTASPRTTHDCGLGERRIRPDRRARCAARIATCSTELRKAPEIRGSSSSTGAHDADLAIPPGLPPAKALPRTRGPGWLTMLPYERLADVHHASSRRRHRADRDAIVRADLQQRGPLRTGFRDRARRPTVTAETRARSAVSSSTRLRAFRSRSRSHRPSAARYVEYAPDSLRLPRAPTTTRLELDIDLDLFETLIRILDGFTPSREELRGAWLNLRIFKDQLAGVPSDALLLSSRRP